MIASLISAEIEYQIIKRNLNLAQVWTKNLFEYLKNVIALSSLNSSRRGACESFLIDGRLNKTNEV